MTEGSRRLRHIHNAENADAKRGEALPPETIERMLAAALQGGRRPPDRWAATGWTPAQLALLGTAADEAVAAQIGRTLRAVRVMRIRQGIPTVCNRRRREHKGGHRP
jgi:hypothetical protein